MKKLGIVLGLVTVFAFGAIAIGQTTDPKKKKISKQVEVSIENGETNLTITTTENGKKTVEKYTGDEAVAKMKEMENEKMPNGAVKVIELDNEESDGDHHVMVISRSVNKDGESGEVDVKVTNEDGKMVITTTKDGKTTVKEIVMPDIDEAMAKAKVEWKTLSGETMDMLKEMNLDSLIHGSLESLEGFNFDINVDSDNGEDVHFIWKDGKMSNTAKKTVIVNEEELTPDEIQKKYGVVVADGDEQVVIVKNVIHVKKDGSNTAKTSSKTESKVADKKVSIYPNPGKSDIYIEFDSGNADKATIEVMDVAGKTIMKRTVNGKGFHKENLSTNDVPAGTYLINVSFGGEKVMQKVILE